MTEHDEQHIIAKQPTLLERLRLTDPEAAQAIERLERERDNAIEQAAMECAVVEELDKTCKVLCQQLAEVRAREGRKDEALQRIKQVLKVRSTSGHLYDCAWCNGSAEIAGEALAAPAPEPSND